MTDAAAGPLPNDFRARLAAALADRYRIDRELGAGGMATVFLAEDLRHGRRVAVKLLRPELAVVLGADRFLAEIRLTAKLQHPNIVPLFDSGIADSLAYYVMPFLDGETLRQRLEREGQLPLAQAVHIARAVASALDYAHQQGVIHRDIKPENIVFEGGQPVVTDFGIALAVHQAGGSRLTETGMSLGTPGYMSPEQATGSRVDARSDIYALACVTYEMMTGEPPHHGNSAQAVIAKVITERPAPVTSHRPAAGPVNDAAVERGLAKLPADRPSTAGEFAAGLVASETSPAAIHAAAHAPGRRRAMPMAGTALLVLLAAAGGWFVRAAKTPGAATAMVEEAPALELALRIPTGLSVPDTWGAFAPDGHTFYIWGIDDRGTAIFGFPLGPGEATRIDGTADELYDIVAAPSMSPDGTAFAVGAGHDIRRVGLDGRPPERLATLPQPPSAIRWVSKDTILVTGLSGGVWTVAVESRTATRIPALDSVAPAGWGLPVLLPSGRLVATMRDRNIVVTSPDRRTVANLPSTVRGVVRGWLPEGYLLFGVPGRGLYAIRLDPATGTPSGDPIRVIEGGAGFSVSPRGLVVFHAYPDVRWLPVNGDGSGTGEPLKGLGEQLASLTSDGRRAVTMDAATVGKGSATVKDLSTGAERKIGLPSGIAFEGPVLTAAGDKFAVGVLDTTLAGSSILAVQSDSSAPPAVLLRDPEARLIPNSWSADGSQLAYTAHPFTTPGSDCWLIGADGAKTLIAGGPGHEAEAMLSPRGDWVAFTSNRTGRREVFVRKLPLGSDEPRQVSTAGGFEPAWSSDGATLYYRSGPSALMAMPAGSKGIGAFGPARVRFAFGGNDWHPHHEGGSYRVLAGDRIILRAGAVVDWRVLTNLRAILTAAPAKP